MFHVSEHSCFTFLFLFPPGVPDRASRRGSESVSSLPAREALSLSYTVSEACCIAPRMHGIGWRIRTMKRGWFSACAAASALYVQDATQRTTTLLTRSAGRPAPATSARSLIGETRVLDANTPVSPLSFVVRHFPFFLSFFFFLVSFHSSRAFLTLCAYAFRRFPRIPISSCLCSGARERACACVNAITPRRHGVHGALVCLSDCVVQCSFLVNARPGRH